MKKYLLLALIILLGTPSTSYSQEQDVPQQDAPQQDVAPETVTPEAANPNSPQANKQQDYTRYITDLVNSEMKNWAQRDIVMSTLKKVNDDESLLSPSDFKIMNNNWKAERRKVKRPLMKKVMDNELSDFLKEIQKKSDGLYTEIVIISAYGLNVGQTMMSEDYWQGDSKKWKNTLATRSYAPYISDLHFDDNTELFQVEVAFMITFNDEPIGVAYAGIDVDQLEDWKKKREQ